ncbi:competence protein ComK [Oceanobacillus limi]|uniref:Competence protein ComK n=1 Tax=Oceanobacillus limi TaxID=930131 RepID=A0A1H9Y006_9BACI|nr:competence protein ComK [Oceanobacillus limi]SES62052.1 competence protein ComK [Oceanobacillus limi]
MKNILPHYHINEHTLALLPGKHIDYQTIALEHDRKLYIKKTPFEIIKRGCLDHYSTYEGRKAAVTHHTGFKRKVPIPISVSKGIYAFPTHPLKDLDCCWVFYQHVLGIEEDVQNPYQSVVVFRNRVEVFVNVGRDGLVRQMERNGEIIIRLNSFRFNTL